MVTQKKKKTPPPITQSCNTDEGYVAQTTWVWVSDTGMDADVELAKL